MPEGVEVYTVAEDCHRLFAGSEIEVIEVLAPEKCPGLEDLQLELKNTEMCIESCHSRGKKLLFDLSDGTWLAFSFIMTGRLVWEGDDDTEELPEKSKPSHVKLRLYIRLANDSKGWLSFCDTWAWGNATWLANEDDFNHYLKAVGPDLMRDEISLEDYRAVLRRKNISRMKISDFVMEQKYFAGVGNYLKAEILFRCRLHPGATLGSLNDDMIERLYEETLDTMAESLAHKGYTIEHFKGLRGEDGTFPTKVYNQEEVEVNGKRYKVIAEIFGKDRKTYWAPDLQLMPS